MTAKTHVTVSTLTPNLVIKMQKIDGQRLIHVNRVSCNIIKHNQN